MSKDEFDRELNAHMGLIESYWTCESCIERFAMGDTVRRFGTGLETQYFHVSCSPENVEYFPQYKRKRLTPQEIADRLNSRSNNNG